MDQCLKEFDGYRIEDIEKSTSRSRQKRLKKKLENLITGFEYNAPKPLKSKQSLISIDLQEERINGDIQSSIVQKWHSKYSMSGGDTSFQFEQKELAETQGRLGKLADMQSNLMLWSGLPMRLL